jgi:hypothetical protein
MKLALIHTRVRFQHLKIAGNIDTKKILEKTTQRSYINNNNNIRNNNTSVERTQQEQV